MGYGKAAGAEKSAILDHLCAVTGWHRDHARKALRLAAAGPPVPRRPRVAVLTYGPEMIEALRKAWAVPDGSAGKRLAPILPSSDSRVKMRGYHGRRLAESRA